jgi:hypothetical protein
MSLASQWTAKGGLEGTTVSKFFSALESAQRHFANGESGPRASEASQDPGAPAETRQRVTLWLEEGQQLLRLLLTENEQLRGRVQAADQEVRTLRATLEEATTALTRLVSETLEPAVTRLKNVRPRPNGATRPINGLGVTSEPAGAVLPSS